MEGIFTQELAALDDERRATVLAGLASVLGWGLWNDLRTGGQSVEEARETVDLLVRGLLG